MKLLTLSTLNTFLTYLPPVLNAIILEYQRYPIEIECSSKIAKYLARILLLLDKKYKLNDNCSFTFSPGGMYIDCLSDLHTSFVKLFLPKSLFNYYCCAEEESIVLEDNLSTAWKIIPNLKMKTLSIVYAIKNNNITNIVNAADTSIIESDNILHLIIDNESNGNNKYEIIGNNKYEIADNKSKKRKLEKGYKNDNGNKDNKNDNGNKDNENDNDNKDNENDNDNKDNENDNDNKDNENDNDNKDNENDNDNKDGKDNSNDNDNDKSKSNIKNQKNFIDHEWLYFKQLLSNKVEIMTPPSDSLFSFSPQLPIENKNKQFKYYRLVGDENGELNRIEFKNDTNNKDNKNDTKTKVRISLEFFSFFHRLCKIFMVDKFKFGLINHESPILFKGEIFNGNGISLKSNSMLCAVPEIDQISKTAKDCEYMKYYVAPIVDNY